MCVIYIIIYIYSYLSVFLSFRSCDSCFRSCSYRILIEHESGQIRFNPWTTLVWYFCILCAILIARHLNWWKPRFPPSGWWPATCQWRVPRRHYQLYRWCCPGNRGWLRWLCQPKVFCGECHIETLWIRESYWYGNFFFSLFIGLHV